MAEALHYQKQYEKTGGKKYNCQMWGKGIIKTKSVCGKIIFIQVIAIREAARNV